MKRILKVWILLWQSGTQRVLWRELTKIPRNFLLGERARSFRLAVISVQGTVTLHEVR